jgi:predicted TIM-barrel enzyme
VNVSSTRGLTRSGILASLREVINSGRPVLGAGCSAGLIAKCAEIGGADLILCYSTGKSRLMGLPTTAIGDSNSATLEMYDEIDNVVQKTPIIGGCEAVDPQYLRLPKLLNAFRDRGYDGIINFPTPGEWPLHAKARAEVGLGIEREAEIIRLARESDYLTMGYAYDSDQAKVLLEAGVDILVPHAGWTVGGMSGAGSRARDLAASAAHIQEMVEMARTANPDTICLAHGGSFNSPEDTEYLYRETDAVGFVGASSVERTPIERAVVDIVTQFKDQHLRDTARLP